MSGELDLTRIINDQDGKRVWHERVWARDPREQDNPGVIIWIGNQGWINHMGCQEWGYGLRSINNARRGFYKLVDTSGYLYQWYRDVARVDGGSPSHVPPASVNEEFAHHPAGPLKSITRPFTLHSEHERCGVYWIGMARFPLPPDWDSPTSFWPGWTHVLHSNDWREAPRGFDFLAGKVNGYPGDLKGLSEELAVELKIPTSGLRRVNSQSHWRLPWLNPKLSTHPFTGELME